MSPLVIAALGESPAERNSVDRIRKATAIFLNINALNRLTEVVCRLRTRQFCAHEGRMLTSESRRRYRVEAMNAGVAQAKNGFNSNKLSGIKSLPAFPAVACKLLGVISNDDADFREVSRLIMTDTALCGQVLRLA